jgi:hypothetical protein
MILLALLIAIQEEVRVVGPGKANAQTPATLVIEPAAMMVVGCDTDADGRTSRQELDACVAKTVGTKPLGLLDYAAWQATWLGDQGALPSPLEVDRDGDDRLTLDEVQVQFSKIFSRLDKNGDGLVTRAEALTIRASAAGSGDRGKSPKGQRIPGGQPDVPPPPGKR